MSAIRADRPAGEAIRALARKTLTGLAHDLATAEAGGEVHGARKRLKFLRGLIRLVAPCLGKKTVAEANGLLRAAADALAGPRRAAALQETVAKLLRDDPALAPALSELANLAAAAHRDDAAPAAVREACALALANAEKLRAQLGRWPLARRDIGLFLEGLGDTYGRARRKLRKAFAAEDLVLLHEARKSVIHHLHQLQMLKPLWPDLIKVWTAELLDLREDLGDLNDLEELRRLAEADPGGFTTPAYRDQTLAAIAGRRRKLLRQAAARHRHLFAEKPTALTRRIGAMWQPLLD
ncbi:MAG: CHAD domain-containing protein [Rhizobiales bacterium]|nr:CHAD domain-containing protein [Hyphomicrobiales bacterium]MBI3671932.1 CHAD domain-containing protein [Hyphomicrobiales bacterium]